MHSVFSSIAGHPILAVVIALVLLLAGFALASNITEPKFVGVVDVNLQLQASVTKTATFNSTALDLGSGYAPGGGGQPMQANLVYSAGDYTTGDESYAFKLQDSPDNSAWTDISPSVTAPVTVAAPAGTLTIGGFVKQRYVRLVATLGGTTPSITYQAYLSPYTVA